MSHALPEQGDTAHRRMSKTRNSRLPLVWAVHRNVRSRRRIDMHQSVSFQFWCCRSSGK